MSRALNDSDMTVTTKQKYISADSTLTMEGSNKTKTTQILLIEQSFKHEKNAFVTNISDQKNNKNTAVVNAKIVKISLLNGFQSKNLVLRGGKKSSEVYR